MFYVVADHSEGRDIGNITVRPGNDTLVADGSQFDINAYPELFKALDGGMLPDLRHARGSEGSSGWRD